MAQHRGLVITLVVAVVVAAVGIGVMALATNDTDEPVQDELEAFASDGLASVKRATVGPGQLGLGLKNESSVALTFRITSSDSCVHGVHPRGEGRLEGGSYQEIGIEAEDCRTGRIVEIELRSDRDTASRRLRILGVPLFDLSVSGCDRPGCYASGHGPFIEVTISG